MNTDSKEDEQAAKASVVVSGFSWSALGAGVVLIALPSAALFFFMNRMAETSVVGLPLLAIFGIVILLGSLSLVSTLFARLGLGNPGEALALPQGSIRATIALSLVVLFALISVMLYQSLSAPKVITGLDAAAKDELLKEKANGIVAVKPEYLDTQACQAARARGASAPAVQASAGQAQRNACDFTYTVYLQNSVSTDAKDLAKQLLILVGTLMTSVTSYYFAAKSAEAGSRNALENLSRITQAVSGSTSVSDQSEPPLSTEEHVDACCVKVTNATSDADLPAAKGGVES